MQDSGEFKNPPIVELVLSAQFSPLTKLGSGQMGWFWKELGIEWPKASDLTPVEDQFELFDRPLLGAVPHMRFEMHNGGIPSRMRIEHQGGDRILQLQNSRLMLNWRKRNDFYPSYRNLIAEFEAMMEKFKEFVDRENLGPILLNQWELTYIDAFAQGTHWETPADWPKILPGMFGEISEATADKIDLESRSSHWTFILPSRSGRLHVSAHAGRWAGDQKTSLLLQMTARGPVSKEGIFTLREGLDLGHNAAKNLFLNMIPRSIQDTWEVKL